MSTEPIAKAQIPYLFWLLMFSVILVSLFGLYKYLFAQNYDFILEAPCDSSQQTCYVRDCEEDYCPPNELAEYRMFTIPAHAFKDCEDNACLNLCSEENGPCTEILCGENPEEDVCSTF